DRSEHEVLDSVDLRETVRDRVRLCQVEADSACAATDLAGRSVRTRLLPSRHDHLAAVVGVRLRKLTPESLRGADDDDRVIGHDTSPFSLPEGGSPRTRRGEPVRRN